MYKKYIKRPIDIVAATLILIVFLPIAIITSLVIRITCGAPVIFRQLRTGRNGQDFTMYKYRTMHHKNNVHDTTNENQMTTVGTYMRALSLDEIPQLINVIKGDMSFIGPRPWIPNYYKHMTKDQRKRASVRPGITGLAQARGRNSLTVFDKLNYDLLYIKKITFTNDCKIVILTLKEMFKRASSTIDKLEIHNEINLLKRQHVDQRQLAAKDFYTKLPETNNTTRIKRNKENNMKEGYLKKKDITSYSVLMSVYAKEEPAYLLSGVESMLNQTLPPNEILILLDGPLTKGLDTVLNTLKKENSQTIRIVKYPKNRGLGPVLADGVVLAKNQLIARMDSDDISNPERCELQLNEFVKDPNLDIVGSNVTEFIDSPNNIVAQRVMPKTNAEIVSFSKKRNPLAHPSVMFKKDTVLEAGNYRDFKQCEDYDLWIRMIKNGAKCHNLHKYLVYMRISPDFYARRGGLTYVKHIVKFKRELLRSGHYSNKDFIVSATSSAAVGLMPNFMRSILYSRFLRTQKPKNITNNYD